MDYIAAFAISSSGMAVEKARVDTVAMNLANTNTTRVSGGGPYIPMHVVVTEKNVNAFDKALTGAVAEVIPLESQPRLVQQPGHPHADDGGFVAYPNINPVTEMMRLIESVRGYEANVRAFNAVKTMTQRALEIGRDR